MEEQETIIRKVKSLIYKDRANTISAHLRTWFQGNENLYFGNISNNKFQIWRFTRGAQGFHPVIYGEVTTNEQGKLKVNLEPKLNPLGYVQMLVGAIILILLTAFGGMNILFALGISLIVILICFFIYRYETKYHLSQLREIVENALQQYV